MFFLVITLNSASSLKGSPHFQAADESTVVTDSEPDYSKSMTNSMQNTIEDNPNSTTSKFIRLYLAATSPREKTYLVSLNIYSGRPNPTYRLTQKQIDNLKKVMASSVQYVNKAPPAVGYRGYPVTSENLSESFSIQGNPIAETFLTNLVQSVLPASVEGEVRSEIPRIRQPTNIVQSAALNLVGAPSENPICEVVPI